MLPSFFLVNIQLSAVMPIKAIYTNPKVLVTLSHLQLAVLRIETPRYLPGFVAPMAESPKKKKKGHKRSKSSESVGELQQENDFMIKPESTTPDLDTRFAVL